MLDIKYNKILAMSGNTTTGVGVKQYSYHVIILKLILLSQRDWVVLIILQVYSSCGEAGISILSK